LASHGARRKPALRAITSPAAFTLVELLVVVAVIVVMMTLAIPAFNGIRGGTDFATQVYNIDGMIEEARAYAMSNNTFVLVGIGEYNPTQSTTAVPQVTGTGRIAIAIVASKDGTRPYQALLSAIPNTLEKWPDDSAGYYATGTNNFVAVDKLNTFQNIHIVDLQGGTPPLPDNDNSGMSRPVLPTTYYDVGNATACISSAGFCWPLGTTFSGAPAHQYQFGNNTNGSATSSANTVIEFDPEGSARIITTQPSGTPFLDTIPQYIEIGLEKSQGSLAPIPSNQTSGQIAAIQIDGMSGTTRIYRP
jgi:prepilin-type N-terminal cleavage/methylation domain-containing protein